MENYLLVLLQNIENGVYIIELQL